MRELGALRESQNAFEADETRLLQSMTVQESVHQWLALQLAFEPQLQQTAALFVPERQAALAQLRLSLRLPGQMAGTTWKISFYPFGRLKGD